MAEEVHIVPLPDAEEGDKRLSASHHAYDKSDLRNGIRHCWRMRRLNRHRPLVLGSASSGLRSSTVDTVSGTGSTSLRRLVTRSRTPLGVLGDIGLRPLQIPHLDDTSGTSQWNHLAAELELTCNSSILRPRRRGVPNSTRARSADFDVTSFLPWFQSPAIASWL